MVSAIQLANASAGQAFGRSATLNIGATEERFLGFSIQPDTYALLSLNNLQGAIELPVSEILPVPQMAPYLLGIVNWRGKSTWVADLAQFMGGEYYNQGHGAHGTGGINHYWANGRSNYLGHDL
jgi:chemotaxis signal transduction protein